MTLCYDLCNTGEVYLLMGIGIIIGIGIGITFCRIMEKGLNKIKKKILDLGQKHGVYYPKNRDLKVDFKKFKTGSISLKLNRPIENIEEWEYVKEIMGEK